MLEFMLGVIVIAAGLLLWARARDRHVRGLRQQVHEQFNAAAAPPALRKKLDVAELATYGTVTATEYAWHWATIDPDLLQAADFSSRAAINSGWDFARYIHDNYASLSEAGKAGFVNRLSGYLAEQKVAGLLEQAGHAVQFAETANQPVWDLIVNEQLVNVKSVADTSSIIEQAVAHPDVIYTIPTDVQGELTENMLQLDGFAHADIKAGVLDGISAAKGDAALDGLLPHLPLLTALFAGYRNFKLWRNHQQEPAVAVRHAVVETIGRGSGVVAGAKLGALVGTSFGPPGIVISSILFGLGGALCGGKVAEWWKSLPLKTAISRLDHALDDYGRSFRNQLPALRRQIMAPINRMRQSRAEVERIVANRKGRLRYKLWPDYYTILLEETNEVAEREIRQAEATAQPALDIVAAAQREQKWKPLGALIANSPDLRNGKSHEDSILREVADTRARVLKERKRLNPCLRLQAGSG